MYYLCKNALLICGSHTGVLAVICLCVSVCLSTYLADGRRASCLLRILFPKLHRDGPYCVAFRYHMFGFHINELRLVVHGRSGGVKTVWWRVKQQKPAKIWHAGEQDLNLNKDDQVTAVNLSIRLLTRNTAMSPYFPFNAKIALFPHLAL